MDKCAKKNTGFQTSFSTPFLKFLHFKEGYFLSVAFYIIAFWTIVAVPFKYIVVEAVA